MSTIQEDVDPAKHPEYLANLVPKQYHDFLPLFTKKGADELPPHRYVDHEIPLETDKKPPMGRMYSMSATELQEIRKWIEENLSKGFIRASSSSCASPILFVKKKDGSLRLCVDYRALNDITIKDRYPLPRIEETLNLIRGAKYFTRLDLRSAYNLIRIKEGDEWKTACRTRYGLFEFLVMPFGLTNAPATCQRFVNDTLREFLDVVCVCYVDDILIYSDNLQDHRKQAKAVLEKLHVAGLFVRPEKCEFEANKTTFLGFVIRQEGIEIDLEKVSAVLNWEVPKTIQDVQCFLGFANFYRRFIEGYSRICTPLFNLLKTVDKDKETPTVTTNHDVPVKKVTNEAPIEWTPCCQQVFDELKSRFCSAPVLKHFDPTLETILETDASDYVVSGILSQRHPDPAKLESRGTLHTVAFLSEKMSLAECNYGIWDKELLAIIACLEKWHMYLHGVPFLIYTDHHNLQNFGTKALLNRWQARWAGLLAQYECQIQFRPGKANGKADALTRRSGDLPKEGDMRSRPFQEILDPVKLSNFPNPVLCNTAIKHNSDICTALAKDELAMEIAKALDNGDKQLTGNHSRSAPLSECIVENGLLYIYGLRYVPNDENLYREILHAHHDHLVAGHLGRAATYELVSQNYWWPGMRKTIARYLANCDTCGRIKPVRYAPYGLLKPMQVPVARWSSVSMDFITGLPKSRPQQHDAILAIVDRLTKMAHYIPTHETVTSEGAARLYFDNIFRLHGLPNSLVSDRGTQFTSSFSRSLCKLVGITQNLSTSFYPQTDSQTERVNAILEQYLQGYINYQQDNWTEILTMAEFAYNNTVSATTGITPFFALYGQHLFFFFFIVT